MKRLLFAICLIALCLLATPHSALAAKDLFGGVDCSQAGSSAACSSKTSSNPIAGRDGLLAHITDIVAFAAGAAAVILIIISALRFISSGSVTSTQSRTDTDVEDARRTIANAVIGLVVIILARTLILFVLGKL